MFLSNSRYVDVPEGQAPLRGDIVTVARLRRLPVVAGEATVVKGNDRLDVIADRTFGDPTQFWHVADANSELEASRLVETPNRVIQVPRQ